MSGFYLSEDEINEDYARGLASWVSPRVPPILLRDFAEVPSFYVAKKGWRKTRDLLSARLTRSSPFWWHTSAHPPLFSRLVQRRGEIAGLLFALLCMGKAVHASSARAAGLTRALEDGVRSGVLREAEQGFHCPVTLMPYRDTFFLADARCLHEAAERYGVRPAARPTQAYPQLRLLERQLSHRRVGRALEIGCGIGLIAIELQRWCDQSWGVDVNSRAIAFARANQVLHADPKVQFLPSDLFDAVDKRMDLVIFNPWQPSESSLPVIERFIAGLATCLAPKGRALLVLDTAGDRGVDVTTAAVARVLREASLGARRFIEFSYIANGSLRLRSLLWIRHVDPARSRAPIRTSAGMRGLVFRLRSLAAGALSSSSKTKREEASRRS